MGGYHGTLGDTHRLLGVKTIILPSQERKRFFVDWGILANGIEIFYGILARNEAHRERTSWRLRERLRD